MAGPAGAVPETVAEAVSHQCGALVRTVFGNHERFETTYFKKFPGFYCTGDGARRDKDGCVSLISLLSFLSVS